MNFVYFFESKEGINKATSSAQEIISLIKTKEASIKEVVIFYLERIKKHTKILLENIMYQVQQEY